MVSQWIKQTFDTVFRPGKTTLQDRGTWQHKSQVIFFLLCHSHFSDVNIEGTQPNVHENMVEPKIIHEQQDKGSQ